MKFANEDFELREVQRLEGHTGKVWNLAWKPTDSIYGVPAGVTARVPAVLASCGEDSTVRIWEQNPLTGSFQCKAILKDIHKGTVRSLAWAPCGKFLATASFDATSAIWKEIGGVFSCVATLEDHKNEVESVAWNASSTLVATCGRDNRVLIWERSRLAEDQIPDSIEFNCISVIENDIQDVKMMLWHHLVDILFVCCSNSTIQVWTEVDLGTDELDCVQILDQSVGGHSSTVWALSFNDRGDKMVSCSDDLTIKIWGCREMESTVCGDGIQPWKHLHTFYGFNDRTVHWSREGLISTGSADGAICLFVGIKDDSVENEDDSVENEDDSVENEDDSDDDASTYRYLLRKEKAHEMGVNAVQWSSMENRCLASAGNGVGAIKIWELCSSTRHKKPKTA